MTVVGFGWWRHFEVLTSPDAAALSPLRPDLQAVVNWSKLLFTNKGKRVGFEVLTAASMKMAVFWVVAPCSCVVLQKFTEVSEVLGASIIGAMATQHTELPHYGLTFILIYITRHHHHHQQQRTMIQHRPHQWTLTSHGIMWCKIIVTHYVLVNFVFVQICKLKYCGYFPRNSHINPAGFRRTHSTTERLSVTIKGGRAGLTGQNSGTNRQTSIADFSQSTSKRSW
jgi:hypothetical protein